MTQNVSQELHVSIDVGCYQHDVSVGLADGKFLGLFEINHSKQYMTVTISTISHKYN